MELPNPEYMDKCTHDYLLHFLRETEDCQSQITGCMKSVMAQYVFRVIKELKLIGDGITYEEMLSLQIKVLRECIISLQICLTEEGTIQ